MTKPYGLMADLHLHRWSSFATDLGDGMNSRLAGLLAEIYRCAEAVDKAGGDTLVFAGDIFHVRGSVAPSVLNPTIDYLDKIHATYGTRFKIIPGNHDLEGKNSTRIGSAVTALQRDFVEIHNETFFAVHQNAVLIPWFDSIADLKQQLEKQSPKGTSREGQSDAIIHAPIDGVIAGLPLHGLDPEYLATLGFRHVFSGHYHNHKAFPGGAVSIGALAHHTWSDVGSKAGFLLVTPAHPELTLKGPAFRWFKSHLPEFVDLTKLIDLDPADVAMTVDRNYVRVRVEASKVKEVEEARKELLDMGALAVLVQAEPKAPVAESRGGAVTIKSGASLEVSVGEFITGMKDLADPKAVAAEALSVLGSVSTMG
jgi:DNA repair exonuclease SbcCD nuclease subunit